MRSTPGPKKERKKPPECPFSSCAGEVLGQFHRNSVQRSIAAAAVTDGPPAVPSLMLPAGGVMWKAA